MHHPLISIIIPVYNAEEFLDRAVDSCLAQSGCDFEVILVNDGSTDGSGKRCDEYVAAHPHFRVIHKPNGGISTTRNAGIAAAKGEYLVFLDADDYLAPDTCAKLSEVIRSHRPDFIDFGWNYVNHQGEITPNLHKLPKNTLLGKDVLYSTVLPPLLNLKKDPDHFIYDFSATKVFCRNIITAHDIRFDESRRIWEDRPFVVSYLRHCENLYCMDCCLYYYVSTEGSLSRRYNPDCLRIIVENYLLYSKLYGDHYDFDTAYVNNYWAQAIEDMVLRSLEQTQNCQQIHSLLLSTLSNDQVVHWYSARSTDDSTKQQISRHIINGEAEKAINFYKKLLKKRNRNLFLHSQADRIKGLLRRVLRRNNT